MKVTILGVIAFAAATHAAIIPYQTTATLVRTPSLDSAVIQSERNNGAFSYSTVENHAYAPVAAPIIQTYATYPWAYYPSFYYPQNIYPTYTFVAQQPSFVASGGNAPNQPPVEVEDPADNTENQEIKQQNFNNVNNNADDDTVAIESA